MGIAILKKMNDCLPDGIKMLFAPLIRRSLIKNPVFIEQYQELIYADTDAAFANERCAQRLHEMLVFAYENTKYYKALFDEYSFSVYTPFSQTAFQKLPYLTRDIIEQQKAELTAENVMDYYGVTTGGSTGSPLHIQLERSSIYREKAFIYHFWSRFGYNYRNSRIATFRGVKFGDRVSKVNPLYNEIILNPFLLSSDKLDSYIDKINSFGVEFLHGYPSSIYNFCILLDKMGKKLKNCIKAVFFISENVLFEQKAYIESILQCPAIAFYGHSERAVFAEQNTEGGYYFNSLYGFPEFTEGDFGSIVCTGFLNRRMPLIRYLLDDYAEKRCDGCYNILGHHDVDVLLGKNNERISMAAINFHDKTFESIASYQFEQWKVGEAKLYVVAKPGCDLDSDALIAIHNSVEKKLQCSVLISVEVLAAPKLSKRGKYKMMIQHISANEVNVHERK
jgi:phenylacetate-CoA ligase